MRAEFLQCALPLRLPLFPLLQSSIYASNAALTADAIAALQQVSGLTKEKA